MWIARLAAVLFAALGLAGCASGPRIVAAEVRANAAQGSGAALLQAVHYRFDPQPPMAGQLAPAQVEALAQGPHRYGRAHFMLDFGKAEAARLGVPCNWQLITVAGIGHDGAAMSRAAAAYWYEGRIPSVEELKPEAMAVA